MLRSALLCSLLVLLCATPEAIRLSLRTHTRHRRSALAAQMLDAPAASEELTPAAKPNSFSSSELKSAIPTKTVPRGSATGAVPSSPGSSSSPTTSAVSSTQQGQSLRQDPTTGPIVVPPITPMTNQFNDMTITHERDTHAALPSPTVSGQSVPQLTAAARPSTNATPMGSNSESSTPKMDAGQTPIATVAKPPAAQPPAPVNQQSSSPAGQPSGAVSSAKLSEAPPASAAQPVANNQAAVMKLNAPANTQSGEKHPGTPAQSASQPSSNAVPSAAAASANPTVAAAKPNEFNDLTVTHDRDTHATAAAASPAQSSTTNQFNDLTITHERDNHADATPASIERAAKREVRQMAEKMEKDSLHELAAEFAAKHLGEDAEDVGSPESAESSEGSGDDLIAAAALPDGPDEESVEDEDAESADGAEEDADEASEDEQTVDAEKEEEEDEESSRVMTADADSVSVHQGPKRKLAQIGDRAQPSRKGSSALRVDADHDGSSFTPYNDMTVAEGGTK